MAASPAAIAVAQEAKPQDLPPVTVETTAQPKPAPKAKKKAAAKSVSPAPQAPSPQPQPVQASPLNGASTPGGNPYANPNAPYQVQQSASGKLTEPLVNTPRTVTAIPKEVLEDKEVRTLRDLARETPGLTIGAAEGGNSYGAFAIRGFKASNDIFVDSIRNPGNVIPDIFSVEQIEIYKGPSGGIAGRGTIGGAINIISKQPQFTYDFYEVGTTIGTDSTVRTTLDVNEKVNSDLAVRANLMYNQNDVAGRDFADSERWGGLLSATARPSDGLQITLDYYRYRNDATPDWGVPINAAALVPYTETGLSRDTWYGQVGLDYFKEKADIGTATVVAKLTDNVVLTNRTRIGTNEVDYVATSPGIPNAATGTLSVGHPQRDQIADMFVNQTELAFKFDTAGLKHHLVAGVEISREKFDRFSYSFGSVGTGGTVSLFNPNPYRNTQFISAKTFTYTADIDTNAVYVTDTVHLSEQWIINGGVRFDDFSRDQRGATANNTAKVSADLFSWNAGIVYKPTPISSLYAAYATSESPIGSELDATGAQYNGLSASLVGVKPQEAGAAEIGTKWELFDRRLLATAALFQTDVENARINDTAVANAFTGEYRIRGVELSVAGNITKEWSVFGGIVVLDSEVLASAVARDVGEPLANTPNKQFSLLTKYRVTPDLALGGQAIYSDKSWAGYFARNGTYRHTVDWWRFDAFAEYQLTKNIELELSALNLTDELYYDAIYAGGSGFTMVAPGRAGYLTVKWKYD